MAELKNEGMPYRVYAEHPEMVPVGWDGMPAPTRTWTTSRPRSSTRCAAGTRR